MRGLKQVLKSEPVRAALCWLGALYIRLVWLTGRWRVENAATAEAHWAQGKPFILAFWHGRILMMPMCWRRGLPIQMLISQHRDGQIISRTVGHFGIDTVVGSSSKGGSAALRSILKYLKNGTCVGITPDGPRGPRMHASEGVAQIARLSGVPVIPCSYSCRRRRLLGSWDRFLVALPFSRGVIVWGEAITIDGGPEAVDQGRLAIEAELNRISALADHLMGQPPVEPAPCS